ncbi:MAG: hypothetical protein JOZ73_12595, partial [Solirubrobacterales bacterium]|nr:hypothetical protein [Solirubrobacterales bacterium]
MRGSLEERSISSWGGAHLTTLICFLAFVAVGNSIGGGVRIALGGHHLRWLGFLINLAASLVLSAWALTRVRAQWGKDTTRAESRAVDVPTRLPRPSSRRPTWLRVARFTLTIVFASLAVVTIATQWGTFQSALGHLDHVQWRPLRWALYAEVLALIAFAQLTRLLLRTGGVNLGLGSMFRLTLASNAIALTLPGGPAWAVTFSVDQLRRGGVRKSLSAYAYVLTWVMSAIALVLIAVVGIDVAGDAGLVSRFHGVAMLLTVAAFLIAAGCLLLIRVPRFRRRAKNLIGGLADNGRLARHISAARKHLVGIHIPTPLLLRCIAAALLN